MKVKLLSFFLFLILLTTVVSSINDWNTYRFDTLHDSVPENTFSRFDTGVQVAKSFAFGNTIQPRVIHENWNGNPENLSSNLIIFGDDDIIRVYDENYILLNSAVGYDINSETHTADFNKTDDAFDIFLLQKDGGLDTMNFTWLQFNSSNNFNKINSFNIGNTSKGITCRLSGLYYCVFSNGESANQTTFHRVIVNQDRTLIHDMLNVGTDGNIDRGCTHIPVLRDIDIDGDLEAIYCADVIGSDDDDIISVDVTNMVLDSSFSGNGIKEDVLTNSLNIEPILVNIDGIDDNVFEIVTADDDNVLIFSATGTTILDADFNAQCVGEIRSVSRTDVNEDSKYNPVFYCSSSPNAITLFGVDRTGFIKTWVGLQSCIDAVTPTGQIVLADLDGTGTPTTVFGMVSPCGIHLLDYNTVLGTPQNNIFNQSGFETTNPIVADTNNNNLYEIVYSKSGNTTIYSADYINSPINFFKWESGTGTPICSGSSMTIIGTGKENENEAGNLGIECYDNDTITWGELVFPLLNGNVVATSTCFYTDDDIGKSYPITVYMSDEGHFLNQEVFIETGMVMTVLNANSTLCFETGEGGFDGGNGTIETNVRAENVEQVGNMFCDVFGYCSVKAKAFIFLGMLLLIILGTYATTKSEMITVLVAFMFTLIASLPSIELIPTWVVLILLLLSAVAGGMIGKSVFTSGEGK